MFSDEYRLLDVDCWLGSCPFLKCIFYYFLAIKPSVLFFFSSLHTDFLIHIFFHLEPQGL